MADNYLVDIKEDVNRRKSRNMYNRVNSQFSRTNISESTMPDIDQGISSRSRSVFDAILEWQIELEKVNACPPGFVQYAHAIEGVLQDPASHKFADQTTERLWSWLDFAKYSDNIYSNSIVFTYYMHTTLVSLLSAQINKTDVILPPKVHLYDSPSDEASPAAGEAIFIDPGDRKERTIFNLGLGIAVSKGMIREQVKHKVEFKSEATVRTLGNRDEANIYYEIYQLGISRFREILESYQHHYLLEQASESELNSLISTFMLDMRDNISDAIINSEFGNSILNKTRKVSSHRKPVIEALQNIPAINSSREEMMSDPYDTWSMRITCSGDDISPARIGKLAWSVSVALESIEGVVVNIEDCGTGSIWMKIKIFINNIWARDQVAKVLETGCKAAVGYYIDKPLEEVNLTKAEREKLEEEVRALKKDTGNAPSKEQADALIDLNIQERKAKVRAQELENALAAMDVITKASELVKDGLIAADKVQLDINEVCAFLFDGTHVSSNPLLPDPDTPESEPAPPEV